MAAAQQLFRNEFDSRNRLRRDSQTIEEYSAHLVSFCTDLSNVVQSSADINSGLFSSCSSLLAISAISPSSSSSPPSSSSSTGGGVVVGGGADKEGLAAVISQRTSHNSRMGNELNALIDCVTDYSNQILHYEQTYSLAYERALVDYESHLARFVAASRRRRQVGGVGEALVDAKLAFVSSMAELMDFQVDVCRDIPTVLRQLMAQFLSILSSSSSSSSSSARDELKQLTVRKSVPLDVASVLSQEVLEFKRNLGLVPLAESDDSVSPTVSAGSKSGYLWKRSRGPRKTWSRRFFILTRSQLLTRRDGSDSIVIDRLQESVWTVSDIDDRAGVFEVAWNGNVMYLQAEGDIESREWLHAARATSKVTQKSQSQESSPSPSINRRFPTGGDVAASYDGLESGMIRHDPFSSVDGSTELLSSSAMSHKHQSSFSRSNPTHSRSEPNLSDSANSAGSSGQDIPVISGVLSIKDMKPNRRPSGAHRDYSNVIWRSSSFSLVNHKLYSTQSMALNTQKELLDLHRNVMNRHYVQESDESLFNRKHVFSISTSGNGTIYYFAAASASERQKWVHFLKEACYGRHVGADGLQYRVYRCLSFRIIEGRNLSGDVYCDIYVGNERKARTPIRKGSDHFWRQDYFFNDLYSLRYGICVIVMSHSRVRDIELGRIVLTQAMLKSGETEAWFPIASDGGISSLMSFGGSSAPGDLKIKFKYDEEVVLTLDQYRPMIDILDVSNPVVYDLANATNDLEAISTLILNVHDAQERAIDWLKFLIDNEVSNTEDANVLFRGNSILTKGMDAYMKLVGMEYLESVLGNVLREIVDEKVACEVDPTRVDKKDVLKNNWSKLMGYAIAIWNSIEESKTRIPREMRILFSYIQQKVTEKYGTVSSKTQMVRFTSVSGFLFLRLFCPCILNPKLFGITRDYADVKTSRTLTLLAKTLQCLANVASFGVKEPYMVDMNSFIMDHVNGLMEFIDHICTTSSNPTPIGSACVHDFELHMSRLNRFVRTIRSSQTIQRDHDDQGPAVPPRTTSRAIEIASNAIEELIANKLT
eukprot:Partr_v1_DN28848_c0_g2_i3_m33871 putative GTPase Activating protein